MQVQVVGIAWYWAEDYDRLMTIFPDRDRLPDTFADWERTAMDAYDTLVAHGLRVVKAYIDPEAFPAWCAQNGHKPDAAGRMAYGQECAHKTANGEIEDLQVWKTLKPKRRM